MLLKWRADTIASSKHLPWAKDTNSKSQNTSYWVLSSVFTQTDLMIILEITWSSSHCRKLSAVGFRCTIYLWTVLAHDGIPWMKFSWTCRTAHGKPCQGPGWQWSEDSPEQCGVDTPPLLAQLLSPTVHTGKQLNLSEVLQAAAGDTTTSCRSSGLLNDRSNLLNGRSHLLFTFHYSCRF